VVELPWAADCCPWVGKLRTVLPLTVGIRDGAVQLVSSPQHEQGSVAASPRLGCNVQVVGCPPSSPQHEQGSVAASPRLGCNVQVVGRARLGGLPCGVIAVETRTRTVTVQVSVKSSA
jgi:hypothetical protein